MRERKKEIPFESFERLLSRAELSSSLRGALVLLEIMLNNLADDGVDGYCTGINANPSFTGPPTVQQVVRQKLTLLKGQLFLWIYLNLSRATFITKRVITNRVTSETNRVTWP